VVRYWCSPYIREVIDLGVESCLVPYYSASRAVEEQMFPTLIGCGAFWAEGCAEDVLVVHVLSCV
jgi:hypothetical protein